MAKQRWVYELQATEAVYPTHARQFDVHQNHIRLATRKFTERVFSVGMDADDFDAFNLR